MPKLPGREPTFRTYQADELMIGYYISAYVRARCVMCGQVKDMGLDNSARVVLETDIQTTVGETCTECTHVIETWHRHPPEEV